MIAHTKRNPCIELGVADLGLRRVRGSVCARRGSTVWQGLRAFSVIENDARSTVIDFSGRLRMSFCRESDILRLSFSAYDPSVNVFRLRLLACPGEFIFGAGERRSRLNLKGRKLPLWVEESGPVREGLSGLAAAQALGMAGAERGVSFPIPVFVSSKNYWCSLETTAWASFDFRNRNRSVIESWAMPEAVSIGAKADAPAVAADLAARFGKQPKPESWAWDGIWLGRKLGPGEAGRLEADFGAFLSAGVKTSALWCEGFDPGIPGAARRRPAWDIPASRAEDERRELAASVCRWRESGIRCLGYADPYLDPKGPRFGEAEESGFLVLSAEGAPLLLPFAGARVAAVDLANPAAAAWLSALMAEERRSLGLSGWLAESGGRLPSSAILSSGERASLVHNRWPLLWAKIGRQSLAAGAAGGYFGMRSGWLGSAPLLAGLWTGGRTADFGVGNGLPSVVPAALSLGLSGMGYVHSEIGGERAPARSRRRQECLMRWMELAAFSPLFRARLSSLCPTPEGSMDKACLEHLALMSEIHAGLKPYHIAVADEYEAAGLPALRHPALHYEAEAFLLRRDYQYLYGRDLFVAPPLFPGRESTELYLPCDDWVHLWSSRRFKGGLVTVESPLGCPAVFYRANSPYAALFDSIRRTAR
jgi:alpha-glucosidase